MCNDERPGKTTLKPMITIAIIEDLTDYRDAMRSLLNRSEEFVCIAAFAAAYWLSSQFRLNQAERVSLMYGLGMNNNGTGLVLASLPLASYPRVMIPIIFYNLVQHLVAGVVHEVMGRTASAPAKSGERG